MEGEEKSARVSTKHGQRQGFAMRGVVEAPQTEPPKGSGPSIPVPRPCAPTDSVPAAGREGRLGAGAVPDWPAPQGPRGQFHLRGTHRPGQCQARRNEDAHLSLSRGQSCSLSPTCDHVCLLSLVWPVVAFLNVLSTSPD